MWDSSIAVSIARYKGKEFRYSLTVTLSNWSEVCPTLSLTSTSVVMGISIECGKMEREALSNIDVLIVGAGLAGLYFAIECYRQGHSPRIIESKSGVELLG